MLPVVQNEFASGALRIALARYVGELESAQESVLVSVMVERVIASRECEMSKRYVQDFRRKE